MRTFIIDKENNITAFASEKLTRTAEGQSFGTQDQLSILSAEWPGSRLAEIWNSLTGVAPVKKFTDKKSAVARIWKAIQTLEPDASQAGDEKAAPSHDVATRRAAKPKATRKAKDAKKDATAAKGPRQGGKTAIILALIRRPKGATLDEIMAAAGWQAHSVRGFLSAVVSKKMGLKLQSSRREDGKRVYQIA